MKKNYNLTIFLLARKMDGVITKSYIQFVTKNFSQKMVGSNNFLINKKGFFFFIYLGVHALLSRKEIKRIKE